MSGNRPQRHPCTLGKLTTYLHFLAALLRAANAARLLAHAF